MKIKILFDKEDSNYASILIDEILKKEFYDSLRYNEEINIWCSAGRILPIDRDKSIIIQGSFIKNDDE